jgi:hypothetical protein
MNKTHGLSLTMQVMNNYKALWLGQPEIRQVINTLREMHTEMELLSTLLIEGNVHSENLQVSKQQMALQVVALMETMAVALRQQRQTPASGSMLVYTYTDIYLAPAKTALSRCQEISQAALQLLPVLKDYGLLSTDIEQVNNAITSYQVNLEKEVVTKQDLTTYTYTLAKLYQEVEDLLQTRLDVLIGPYANTHPKFFMAYQQSRIQEPF